MQKKSTIFHTPPHPSLLDKLGIVSEDLVQAIAVKTFIESEALGNLVDLLLSLASEVFCPLLNKEFGNKNVTSETTDTVTELPNGSRI